ncbi:CTLH [Musa troglodytarum]|uniref:CTLH n=1 Tax=Musa troglodytarum TaxID=320322 RepID=A0A9E7H2U9_9LILI|nr:CTLH [Musa troglodytarum]
MGGLEDDEPPAKRVKASSAELRSLLSTSSSLLHIGYLGVPMAKPLPFHGEQDMIGSKGVIKRAEFVRIITKTLYSLGYEKSGAILEEESGISLHSSVVNLFRKQVLDGNWDGSLETLHKIGLADENLLKYSSFLILEQKYFELLETNGFMDALKTLRCEITPLGINKKRVHELASCIVSPSHHVLLRFANLGTETSNPRLKLLEELQKLLPPTVMIPERRLEHLVEQALGLQRESCYFHNSLDSSLSLYADHNCGKDQLPSHTAQVHEDGGLSLKHKLIGHQKAVLMIAWSPDDNELLTCGMEEVIRVSASGTWMVKKLTLGMACEPVYIWHRGSGDLVEALPGHSGAVNCVSWNPSNPHMLASASDDHTIRVWGLSKKVDLKPTSEGHSNGVVAHRQCNGHSK